MMCSQQFPLSHCVYYVSRETRLREVYWFDEIGVSRETGKAEDLDVSRERNKIVKFRNTKQFEICSVGQQTAN